MNTPQCLLACGCWTQLPLNLAVVYSATDCPHHGITSVTRVNTHEWRVRCPDCRYGRWCGQDRDEALRRQQRHKQAHHTHYPSVAYDRITWDGQGTILRWDGKRPRRNPPPDRARAVVSLDDAPPF